MSVYALGDIASARIGKPIEVHTAAGKFTGTLELVIGAASPGPGSALRVRCGATFYDVDLAQVAAISYPVPDPFGSTGGGNFTASGYFSIIDGHFERVA
jgi:hypothetical protein